MKHLTRRTVTLLLVLVLAASGGLVACGDDDDDGGGGGGGEGGGDVEGYCDLARELSQVEGELSEEQLDQIVEVAPEEIREDVETVVATLREPDLTSQAGDAGEAAGRIGEFEQENCA